MHIFSQTYGLAHLYLHFNTNEDHRISIDEIFCLTTLNVLEIVELKETVWSTIFGITRTRFQAKDKYLMYTFTKGTQHESIVKLEMFC